MYQEVFSCTLRGIYIDDPKARHPVTTSWTCPSTSQVTATTPQLAADGSPVGNYQCISGTSACSGGVGALIPSNLVSSTNSKMVKSKAKSS